MKDYTMSQQELDYLKPLEAVRASLENQIKAYIGGVVLPRLGIRPGERKVVYDIFAGKVSADDVIIPRSQIIKPKDDNTSHTKSK